MFLKEQHRPMMLGGASVGVYAVVAIVLFPMLNPFWDRLLHG